MRIELLDDLPVLGAKFDELDLASTFDKYFPDHGLWQGISGGKLAIGWLLYILTQGDHRLSHVEDWSALRLESLKAILGEKRLTSHDFCDDRLGRLLDRYSVDEDWYQFEESLGSQMIEVYKLVSPPSNNPSELNVIRTDSFNAPQFRAVEELFTYGHNKQRRPDQPFCKVVVSALDPLAMPLVVEIVRGGGTDVSTYLPNIERVQAIIGFSGNLYVGDSKLGSLTNRLTIHDKKDYYLSPLGRKQCTKEKLDSYLDEIKVPIEELPSIFTEKESKRATAYFYESKEIIQIPDSEDTFTERRILVYSPNYAKKVVKSLNNRLDEAQLAIENLVIPKKGRRNPKSLGDLQSRIASILKEYKVVDFFEVVCTQTIETYEVQKYKDRPAGIRQKVTLQLNLVRKEENIAHKRKRLGWQVYATNAPQKIIDAAELVRCYRNEYRIEHLFDYMINRDVGLLPIYLQKQDRIKGLIRLLSVAMKFSTIIQYQVRTELSNRKKEIKEIYPGNKGRSTNMPTTPMLLRAFKGLGVAFVQHGNIKIIEMTALNNNQQLILELLGISQAYQKILKLLKTPQDLHEM